MKLHKKFHLIVIYFNFNVHICKFRVKANHFSSLTEHKLSIHLSFHILTPAPTMEVMAQNSRQLFGNVVSIVPKVWYTAFHSSLVTIDAVTCLLILHRYVSLICLNFSSSVMHYYFPEMHLQTWRVKFIFVMQPRS